MAQPTYYMRMTSPLGPLLLAAGEKGLFLLKFGDELPDSAIRDSWLESPAHLSGYADELRAYFRGNLRHFTGALDLRGSLFQKRCWHALCAIPYGETRTYRDLAVQVGSPRAFRAVGQANHHNPIAIIVPCHRVIGADGTLTGYGGGLAIKQKLLLLEGVSIVHPLNLELEFSPQL